MRTRNRDPIDGDALLNTTEQGNSSHSNQNKDAKEKRKQKPSSEVGPAGTNTGGGDEDMVPVQPLSFFFEPSQFSRFPKIGTRCDPQKCVKHIRELGGNELNWFLKHPQFKHIFHMHLENNRKVMGAWSLILRMAKTEKPQQLWFVVNGVPIRYGLREHGLISGLYCHQYPKDYENLGGNRFVHKYFGKTAKPWVDHVFKKLGSMSPSEDRIKMTLLWFLAIVIRGKTKVAGPIDPFLLRIVDDLHKCETFPWGRLTFEDCEIEIRKICDRMKGTVMPNTTIPGFILPLELLPFEAIPNLKKHFRENVACEYHCPRMCRGKFKELNTKGFGLGDIYKSLGNSTEISSILMLEGEDRRMIAQIMGEEDDLKYDMIVDGWNTILANGGTILWKDLLEIDLAHRNHPTIAATAHIDVDAPAHAPDDHVAPPGILESIREMSKAMTEGFKTLNEKVGCLTSRIENLEKSNLGEPSHREQEFDNQSSGDDGDEEEDTGEENSTDISIPVVVQEVEVGEEEATCDNDADATNISIPVVVQEVEVGEEEATCDNDVDGTCNDDAGDADTATVEAQGTVVPETQAHDCTPHGPIGYTGLSDFSGFSSNVFASLATLAMASVQSGKENFLEKDNAINLATPVVLQEVEVNEETCDNGADALEEEQEEKEKEKEKEEEEEEEEDKEEKKDDDDDDAGEVAKKRKRNKSIHIISPYTGEKGRGGRRGRGKGGSKRQKV